jgi:hypothetical protein
MNQVQKQSFKNCFKGSFKYSTPFLVDWVNHFEGEESPLIWAYKAQLRLRGVTA